MALPSTIATVLPENIASEKILTKLDFVFEENIFFMGKLCRKYKADNQTYIKFNQINYENACF